MDLSLRDFELRKRRARGLFATQSAIFSASETRVRSAVNSNSVGTFPSGRSHSNPEGTSGQKAESLPKPRHGQSPLQKIETERILPNGPTSSSMDLSLRDFELRKPRARGLFATQSAIFSASETRVRRGWDSNPRGTFIPAGFQDRCLQPLGHPSIAYLLGTYGDWRNLWIGLTAYLLPTFLESGKFVPPLDAERSVERITLHAIRRYRRRFLASGNRQNAAPKFSSIGHPGRQSTAAACFTSPL